TTDAASKNEQHSDKETVARDTPVQSGIDRLADEPPRMLHMEVNGKKIPFELDTGASLSIIDEKTWRKLGRPQLQKAEVAATAFDNKRITFQGKFSITYCSRQGGDVDIHVFKEASRFLCGRDMIRRLQINCGPHYELCTM
ncbi:hypothetical protein OSTOST_05675, partial [Ostertagia ostertagi]